MKQIQKHQQGNYFQQLKQRLDKTIADSQKKISGYKKRRPRKIKVRSSASAFMPASARLYNASHTDVYEDQDPKDVRKAANKIYIME